MSSDDGSRRPRAWSAVARGPGAVAAGVCPWLSHQAVGGEAIGGRLARCEQPPVTHGDEHVAVPAPVVDADVRDREKVAARLDTITGHHPEPHARNMVTHMGQRDRACGEATG